MEEIWEKAVETALDGEADHASARTLTLDSAVKCIQGRLPPPSFLERFQNLEHFSIANIGVSSLEQFPRLRNLQRLILSDNRIAGGLEFLVQAGLHSLRDLDLSNNRIQFIEDLAPLAQLKLVSLDLYECPVTRIKDYRSRVFGLINSLKYLDKMDVEENERPESDDEEEEEDDDPGSGEIDGEDQPHATSNGHRESVDGVVDVDEEESEADDEEEVETSRWDNVLNRGQNSFQVPSTECDNEDKDDKEEEDEIDEEEGDDEDDDVVEVHEIDDVVEVHEIDDSDDEEDNGVEFDEDDNEEDEEEVDNDEGEFAEPESTELLASTEGEIDGHEQGEENRDEDDNGETGEDEMGVEFGESSDDDDDDDEEEDYGAGYLVQPVGQPGEVNAGGASMNGGIEEELEEEEEDEEEEDELEDEDEEEEVDDDDEVEEVLPPTSSNHKRKRDGDGDEDDDSDEQ